MGGLELDDLPTRTIPWFMLPFPSMGPNARVMSIDSLNEAWSAGHGNKNWHSHKAPYIPQVLAAPRSSP